MCTDLSLLIDLETTIIDRQDWRMYEAVRTQPRTGKGRVQNAEIHII